MKYIAEKGNCVFEVLGPIDSEYYIASYMPKEESYFNKKEKTMK